MKRVKQYICLLLAVLLLTASVPVSVSAQQASAGSRTIPLYFQTDYPDQMYGCGTVADNGCGITCLAMAATYLTGHTYLPDELARYFGGKADNNIARLEYASDALQLPYYRAENWHEAYSALHDGKLAIVLMGNESIFTNSQHFILLTGISEDGKIYVNDPNPDNYDYWLLKKGFADGFDEGDILCGYSGAWIYDPEAVPEDPYIYYEEQLETQTRYSGIMLTDEETDLLARVVWAEARGECAQGQQAVAEVVLNRLAAGCFAQTLSGVIYDEGQFCSVPYLDDAQPTQTQYDAIHRAINGPYVLPMDVMKFANYPASNDVWGQIGGHYFFFQ